MAFIDIPVPDLGDIADAAIIEILVKSGQTVAAEQSLITLESDKASMEVPSPQALPPLRRLPPLHLLRHLPAQHPLSQPARARLARRWPRQPTPTATCSCWGAARVATAPPSAPPP